LSAEHGGANLLPAPARRALLRGRALRWLATAAVLAAVAVTAGGAHLGTSLSSLRARIAEQEARWQASTEQRSRVEHEAVARERARTVDTAIASLIRTGPPWSQALESLGLLLPDDARVERLTGAVDPSDGRWQVALRVEFRGDGVAEAAESVSDFAAALRASPLWTVRQVERQPDLASPADDASTRVHFLLATELAPLQAREAPPASGDAHG
jgi:Tfp pilus assembly protein PilN